MSLPTFTAQASLYRTSTYYRSAAFDRASQQRGLVIPQLGGPGFEGYANCFIDCKDKGRTDDQCKKLCSDPVGYKVPTYHPGQKTQIKCNDCIRVCTIDRETCDLRVAASLDWWNPVGGAWLHWGCANEEANCRGYCNVPRLGPCCPKECGPRDSSRPGEGCCDRDDSCCGGTCCPPSFLCQNGVCSPPPPPPLVFGSRSQTLDPTKPVLTRSR